MPTTVDVLPATRLLGATTRVAGGPRHLTRGTVTTVHAVTPGAADVTVTTSHGFTRGWFPRTAFTAP